MHFFQITLLLCDFHYSGRKAFTYILKTCSLKYIDLWALWKETWCFGNDMNLTKGPTLSYYNIFYGKAQLYLFTHSITSIIVFTWWRIPRKLLHFQILFPYRLHQLRRSTVLRRALSFRQRLCSPRTTLPRRYFLLFQISEVFWIFEIFENKRICKYNYKGHLISSVSNYHLWSTVFFQNLSLSEL